MKTRAISLPQPLFLLAFILFILGAALLYIVLPSTHTDISKNESEDAHNDAAEYSASVARIVTMASTTDRTSNVVGSSTPQFVILSFDGSKSLDMLTQTLDFTHKMREEGKPLSFTYFINAAYFLTESTANIYQGPRHARGYSNIGFSESTKGIARRMHLFNQAFAEGNEIGSHSVGHFNGEDWTYDEWKQEFNDFSSIMQNVNKNNSSVLPSLPIEAPLFLGTMSGFRAPDLGVNDNLYKVLAEHHFTYDTSGVGYATAWPHKDEYGIWHIPLGTMFLGPQKRPTISMDFSIRALQSGGEDVAVKGTPLWDQYFNETKQAYLDYFNYNYEHNRAPVIIANHFANMNDYVYWEAMKSFAEEVCGKPQVRCTTFKALVRYLNRNGVPSSEGAVMQ